jgi:hypothetical protein
MLSHGFMKYFKSVLRNTVLTLLTIWVFSTHAPAQTQPSYFFLGAKEFDGVQIYDVIQDDDLNYWISTDNGIYVYDSYTFTKKDIAGSVSSEVFGFVKNRTGTIYCYNLNNQIIQIADGVCSVFYNLTAEERSTDIYLSITWENDLLIFTRTILLFNPNGKRIQLPGARFRYFGSPFPYYNGKTISHLIASDSLLVYQNRTVSYVKMNTQGLEIRGVLQFFYLNHLHYAISSETKSIYLLTDDFRLLPTERTVLEETSEPYRIYSTSKDVWAAGVISGVRLISMLGIIPVSDNFYSQYLISDVFEDAEGNILLSTFNHGILVVPDISIPDVLQVPAGNSIMSIQSDDKRGMLMGTLTGKLLSYNHGTFTTLCDSGARPLQSIFSWPEFPFVVFDDGVIKAMNKENGQITRLTFGSLKDAALVDDSTIYLALNRGLLRVKWKGGTTFESTSISSLHIRCTALAYSDADQLLYVATSDGVHTVDKNGTASPFIHNGSKIFANDIAYSDGITYLCTDGGIIRSSKGNTGEYLQLFIREKRVQCTRLSVNGEIISAITSAGFAQFDLDGKLVMQLNTQQGFSTNRLYDFDIAGDDIWICHSQGVQQLNASTLQVPVEKPLLKFSGFTINDTIPGNLNEEGVYSSDQRKFRFVLSSPTLRNKENIRYTYQLAGYDDALFTADYADNEIVYNALAPGHYTLTVQAENSGVLSDPLVYKFTISAPFYTTWWFTAIVIVSLLLAVTLVYRYRLIQQEKKAKLENELATSRLTAIQSQMNPHFIFNSLNSIQDLVLKGDIDNSYTFITKFSNLVRRTLNYSDKDFVEFGQEIKLLELYLSLEKLRFKEDLEYTLNTNEIDDILVPPMLIQPFIENSLLHGLLHKEGKKRLSISFELKENLICIIEDNGIGREKAKEIKNRQRGEHESFSGEAIKKRFSILSRIFQSELGYIYEDRYEGDHAIGTRVKLTIPVKRNF